MASLFISYSRKDIDFARKLTEAFKGHDLDFWIDWEGIPPTVDWWKEIEKGIEEADIFLFLISPDSSRSKVCRQEIEHAIKNGKRLIPIVVRDIKGDEAPPELGHLNWIFIREVDDFNNAFDKLITAIKTDFSWVQIHRRLQVRALEWERGSKDNSFLLRGKELQDAEAQLVANAGKGPKPTDLQTEYVLKSRQASNRQRRRITSIAIVGIIIMAALTIFGLVQARLATNNATEAQNQASTAQAASTLAIANENLANERTRVARSGLLAAQAAAVQESDFQLSSLLSIEAYISKDTIQSRGSLLNSIQQNPRLLRYLNGPRDPVASIAYRADGRTPITSVAFSPDGRILASGSDDNTVVLWNMETGQSIGQALRGHLGSVNTVAFSPDGKIVASGSYDKTIILWDVSNALNRDTESVIPIDNPLSGHAYGVTDIAFSPDGKFLASGSCHNADDIGRCTQGEIILWNVKTRQPIHEPLVIEMIDRPNVNVVFKKIVFSPDGKMLISSSETNITTWDLETYLPTTQPVTSSDTYSNFTHNISPDGKILASVDYSSITLLDIETGQPIGEPLVGHANYVTDVAFSPDSKFLASASSDNTVIIWSIDPVEPDDRQFAGHSNTVNSVAFSPNGKIVASAGNDTSVILWDAATGKKIGQPLVGHTDAINSVAFNPKGNILASGSADHTIILWDVETGQQIGSPLTGHTDIVKSVAFSPDGKILASGSDDQTIILWNVETGQPMFPPLTGHTNVVNSIAFSPDGKLLASGSWDSKIFLWNVETGKQVGQTLVGHTDFINTVAFSPNGRTLASGSWDYTILLWDVPIGLFLGPPLTGANGWINSLAFSPDGKYLASGANPTGGNELTLLLLWDVESRQIVSPLLTNGYSVNSVTFSPDGKMLATGSLDTVVRLWDIDPNSLIVKICQRVGRNFTQAEWKRYFLGEEYRITCPQWPKMD